MDRGLQTSRRRVSIDLSRLRADVGSSKAIRRTPPWNTGF